MNVFDELNDIFRHGYNGEKLQAIKPKLENYLTICPEEEKAECERKLALVERLIKECKEVDKLRQQYNLFYDYVQSNADSGLVELKYTEPFGDSYGVEIKVGNYTMELVFKPVNGPMKNEVRTKFFINVGGLYKQFMIRKDMILPEYQNLQHKRRDFYPTSVTWDNWADLIIDTIKKVTANPQDFLRMCKSSCPFNNNV